MVIANGKVTSANETATDSHSCPQHIGIPKEIHPGEYRVAATPDVTKTWQRLGFTVLIEAGAGEAAHFSDQAYKLAGCEIVSDPQTLWGAADLILKVRSPEMHPLLGVHEAELLREGSTLISFIWASQNPQLLERLGARRATVLAMDAVPRISRAQKIDALSSMGNLAGYRAVIEAANHFSALLGGQITAAGKIPPARVLVIGAGVAGLAAIATARGLGAVVRGFDTRPVVKEQVQSLGAEFLELSFAEDGNGQGGYAKVMSQEFIQAEMELFAAQAREVDIIITTALIPGQPAPKLISAAMVESMQPGSVIIDMAAEQGGNCALTQPGQVYSHQGVTIVGLSDYPSRMAHQASQLYGTNLYYLLEELGGASDYRLELSNEIVRGMLILHLGEKPLPQQPTENGNTGEPAQESLPARQKQPQPPTPKASSPPPIAATAPSPSAASVSPADQDWTWLLFTGIALLGVGTIAPASFLSHLTVFVLACFVGWEVIWNVKPALHTPLMSVTNAISGIIIVGGMLQFLGDTISLPMILGAIAIFLGTINISGGFSVTQRMLRMFQR
ncbi:MAG: Re/Si-specific NAD(P)(+) transhydrogenase subunit alpha [Aphanocapsa sp. GSE-SYN-MK-11-07L]|jgi:NAD(P) transhydrogenase subunit alpha|nr:Re/Si-specific NAD(P)(+) transhydrogenase subunit alpha [Aphanocapsa sp. GSE-SYN-MK-11-07L]